MSEHYKARKKDICDMKMLTISTCANCV